MADEDAVGIENIIRVFTDARAVVKKRTLGSEFFIEKLQAFLLRPFREILSIGDSRRSEDFGDGVVVELGVLADIERGQVKAKHFDLVPDRADRLLLEKVATSGRKRAGYEIEILGKLFGRAVSVFSQSLLAEDDGHEAGKLPPRLLGLPVENFLHVPLGTHGEGKLVDTLLKLLGNIRQMPRNREL